MTGQATITVSGHRFAGVSDVRFHDPDRATHGVIPMRLDRPESRASVPWVNAPCVLILGDPIDLEATSEHDQRSST